MHSATAEYPTATDLIETVVTRVRDEGNAAWWANLEPVGNGDRYWVQINRGDDGSLLLNFAYPLDQRVHDALANHAIVVPPSWTLVFEETGKAATFSVPDEDVDVLTGFVDELFKRLFRLPDGYVLSVNYDG